MGIRYSVKNDLDLAVVLWKGSISLDEWIRHLGVLTTDPGFAVVRKHITELRHGSPDASVDEAGMKRVINLLQAHRNVFAGRQMAVVATEDFKRARMFEMLSSSLKVNMIVFNDLAPACLWLGIAPAKVEKEFTGLHAQD